MNAPDERDLVDDGLEDDPEEPPEAEVHELGLDLADGELDIAVRGEHEVHVHDDLVTAHVLVVHLRKKNMWYNIGWKKVSIFVNILNHFTCLIQGQL